MSDFFNNELEQQILGIYILKNEFLDNTSLETIDFYDPTHNRIFGTMQYLRMGSIEIDSFTLQQADKSLNLQYLIHLSDGIASTANIEYHEKQLKELSRKRQAAILVQETKQAINENEDVDSVLTSLTERANTILNAVSVPEIPKREKLMKYFNKLEKRDGSLRGAPTGFPEIDRMLNGLVDTKFIVVAARPSVGKSAFANNLAINVGKADIAAVFSLEMPEDDLTERMISNLTNINGMKFRAAGVEFNQEDWSKVVNAIEWVEKSGIHIYDNPNTNVIEIKRKLKKLKDDNPGKKIVAIIDYLQLIRPVKPKGNRQEEVSEISRELKLIANELGICMIALSQLSRAVETRQDKRPMLSDIRESGSIEQDSDIIMFLYRDDYYDKESENKNIVEIIIAKNRDGAIGTVNLAMIKEFSKFVNLERRFS